MFLGFRGWGDDHVRAVYQNADNAFVAFLQANVLRSSPAHRILASMGTRIFDQNAFPAPPWILVVGGLLAARS